MPSRIISLPGYVAGVTLIALVAIEGATPVAMGQDKPPADTAGSPFKDGFPTLDAAPKLRDDSDFQRAVIAYRFWYPTVSIEGLFHGNREQGIGDNEAMPILAAGPRHVGFTLNSDTPYGGGVIDLKDGPMVVELPAGPFIGLANDHHQRFIADMGLPGPDAGKGGKHLILPPAYRGDPPAGYHVGRSASFKVLVALRSIPVNGDVAAAMTALRSVRIYPLSTAPAPRLMKFVDMTAKAMDCTSLRWEDNMAYWETLHEVIDAEPMVGEFRPMYGLLAALGIEKGKPFAPDARTRMILERAAKTGRDELLVSAFASARPDRLAWPDRKWEWVGLVPDNGDFETPSGLDTEARDRWFAQAIVSSPAMFRRKPGAGSLYWLGLRDQGGAYLDGGMSYRLTVPGPVPAGLFWSVTVYDAATRSQVRTEQDKAVLSSLSSPLTPGADGSVDLHFGPGPPTEPGRLWIRTEPGRGWFAYFRIYGPKSPAFDGTWKPGDFERVR